MENSRWGLIGYSLIFYIAIITLGTFIFEVYDYPNIDFLKSEFHPQIVGVYEGLSKFNWLIYYVLAIAISPFVVAKCIQFNIFKGYSSSQENDDNGLGSALFFYPCFLFIFIIFPSIVYFGFPFKVDLSNFHLSLDLLGGVYTQFPNWLWSIFSVATGIALFILSLCFDFDDGKIFFPRLTLLSTLLGIAIWTIFSDLNWQDNIIYNSIFILVLGLFFFSFICSFQNIYKNWFDSNGTLAIVSFISLVSSYLFRNFLAGNEDQQIWLALLIALLLAKSSFTNLIFYIKEEVNLDEQIQQLIHTKNQRYQNLVNNIGLPEISLNKYKLRFKKLRINILAITLFLNSLQYVVIIFINNFVYSLLLITNLIFRFIEYSCIIILNILSWLNNFTIIFTNYLSQITAYLPNFLGIILALISVSGEIIIRFFYLPLIFLSTIGTSLYLVTNLLTDYFLVSQLSIFIETIFVLVVYWLAIIVLFSLCFQSKLTDSFHFWTHPINHFLSYTLLANFLSSWLFIGVDKFILKIGHFQAGLISKLSLGLIIIMILWILRNNFMTDDNEPEINENHFDLFSENSVITPIYYVTKGNLRGLETSQKSPQKPQQKSSSYYTEYLPQSIAENNRLNENQTNADNYSNSSNYLQKSNNQKETSNPDQNTNKQSSWSSLTYSYADQSSYDNKNQYKSSTPENLPANDKNFTEILPNGIKLEMVYIPAGSFMMGSNESRYEQPIHEVTFQEGFYMGKYPLTQAQYEAVMGNNPSYFQGENNPVECVSWNNAQEFCQKLSQLTGKKYQLPSESQWEYACRAGSQTRYYFGDAQNQLSEFAWYSGNSYRTHSVGEKSPNAWGLYDMYGYVWEWCADNWHNDYQNAPIDGSAWIDNYNRSLSDAKVVRGGSWHDTPRNCRSASRGYYSARVISKHYGFRVVCS